jgi:hypothetical protein
MLAIINSLCIDSATMWAGTFLTQFGTTVATAIAVVGMALVAPKGKGNVGHEEEVADIVEGEDGEDHIDDSTDGSKA